MAMLPLLAAPLILSPALTATPAFAAEVPPDDVEFADEGVMSSLTGKPGDPSVGAEVFASRKQGNCLACHANGDLAELPFHGNVGPPLDGVADRYEEPFLRAIVADAKQIFTEETVMPGFYTLKVGHDVAEQFKGKTILSAQEVEDVVAYLTTLKEE
ncbi:sulfur oxidation c-type cytochrome SoxX [Pseudohoeflea sp. DP4N28-3]|uniref:Sulfur oxidation c-type cytochrome SoxX n=2 Tax=Pseudohoeflea coraliihabitans TaxID=2860393 RepID=A0ABS6WQZ6_9HYPH|nr:sulfur oxidation c-type cytochrome SoxX [Pseudohoeflea sp. DP4N28-3]